MFRAFAPSQSTFERAPRPRPRVARHVDDARPVDTSAWTLRMEWRDVLFAHWDVAPSLVQAVLPHGLDVDTYDGRAWIGIVPLRATGVRARYLPPIPGASSFTEVGLRTYVWRTGQRGAYYFSLDASSSLAVVTGRKAHLHAYNALASYKRKRDITCVELERTHEGMASARLTLLYQPSGPAFHAEEGSLERWLTERHVLLATMQDGATWRIDVDHEPWVLRRAEAMFLRNTLAVSRGLDLPSKPPHLLHAGAANVLVLPPEKLVDLRSC